MLLCVCSGDRGLWGLVCVCVCVCICMYVCGGRDYGAKGVRVCVCVCVCVAIDPGGVCAGEGWG